MGLVFLSAFLFYFSFPNRIQMHGFWPCIWFFAVPLLLALQGQSLKRRLLYGSVWGLCAYGLMAQGLITISWVGFCAFILGLSIQSVIFAALYPCWISSGVCCVYRAVLWGASECVRNYLLGGFSFYISHAHAFCPWMLSSYGFLGCAAMSFVIFAVNSFLFEAIIAPQKRWVAGALAGVLFLAVARSVSPKS